MFLRAIFIIISICLVTSGLIAYEEYEREDASGRDVYDAKVSKLDVIGNEYGEEKEIYEDYEYDTRSHCLGRRRLLRRNQRIELVNRISC